LAFILEFFFVTSDGRQTRLGVERRQFSSVERAEAYSRMVARNVKLKDKLANFCIVRDNRGRTLSEVVYAAAAPKAEKSQKAELSNREVYRDGPRQLDPG
jgi:hypothetical protein